MKINRLTPTKRLRNIKLMKVFSKSQNIIKKLSNKKYLFRSLKQNNNSNNKNN